MLSFFRDVEQVFRDLALEAGAAIMAVHAKSEISAAAKADASPVTEADLAADAIISAGLARAFPALPVVTEEQAASQIAQTGRFVLVDPLDGTREFLRRNGEFTVNIALIEGGVPIRGVVYAPALGRLFYTLADGASVEETPEGLRALAVATPDNRALRVVASKSHRDSATDALIARYQVAELVSAGSSLKFALVAAGEADFYPRLGRTMEWDTAAGDALLRGAGGMVVNAHDLTPLHYGKAGFENPHFFAMAPGVRLHSL